MFVRHVTYIEKKKKKLMANPPLNLGYNLTTWPLVHNQSNASSTPSGNPDTAPGAAPLAQAGSAAATVVFVTQPGHWILTNVFVTQADILTSRAKHLYIKQLPT